MNRRMLLRSWLGGIFGSLWGGSVQRQGPEVAKLFPADAAPRGCDPDWAEFPAAGFSGPACGVIYRRKQRLKNGMPQADRKSTRLNSITFRSRMPSSAWKKKRSRPVAASRVVLCVRASDKVGRRVV